MRPIGSTSSNVRRAIKFIVYSSCHGPGALVRELLICPPAEPGRMADQDWLTVATEVMQRYGGSVFGLN